MPELNPYEAPQSELARGSRRPPATRPVSWWVKAGLAAQVGLVVAMIAVSLLAGRFLSPALVNGLMLVSIAAMGLLTAGLFVLALRERYGWLIVVEFVLFAYALLGFITSVSRV